MKNKAILFTLFLALTICLFPVKSVHAGVQSFGGFTLYSFSETDTVNFSLFYFFDLRERETFIQLTNPDLFFFEETFPPLSGPTGLDATAHVQIFDVSNNCNENNFFDVYTPSDTHVYNMRDIQTNDGNPSGVILPDGAYGIVTVTMSLPAPVFLASAAPIGNLRIIDNNGYEYRANAQGPTLITFFEEVEDSLHYSFNFNREGGVSLSDVVGITLRQVETPQFFEWVANPVQGIFTPFDIDIVNNNETIFSCRDIIYSCVDEYNPLLEELLSIAGTANVARFEYGINEAIPHSKGGELLCPGNNISEGTVLLRAEPYPTTQEFEDLINSIDGSPPFFAGYIGLNNGNGRGSFDSFWVYNLCQFFGSCEPA